MSAFNLRGRLAAALVAVTLFAVALAALIGNLGLMSRLDQAARTRLDVSATHVADIAAAAYRGSGGWTPATRSELRHVAALDGLRIAIRLPNGRLVEIGPAPKSAMAQSSVVVAGNQVATAIVSSASGRLLNTEEQHLGHSLDQLHLLAAVAAAVAALVAGLLLAQGLTRSLREIRAGAERLACGEIDARVEVGAEPEVRAVGQALNRLAETLQKEEVLRKESVDDLAHELRTPVNGLLTRIEAAQDKLLPPEDNLAAMHAEVLCLTRLLDDLARLGDAERPGLLLDKSPLDLGEVAAALAGSFAPRFAEAEIDFSTTCEPAWVAGDRGRLEQVVANLLSNALFYTAPGGHVSLTVGRRGSESLVEVADTGVGIAPDDLRHIFTRFWRADRSRSPATGGTGIGLTIVAELVRAHEGHIDVESAPSRGSCFSVVLPALDHPPAAAAFESRQQLASGATWS